MKHATLSSLKHTRKKSDRKPENIHTMKKQRGQNPRKNKAKNTEGHQKISKFLIHKMKPITKSGATGPGGSNSNSNSKINHSNAYMLDLERESNGHREGELKQLSIGDLLFKAEQDLGRGQVDTTDQSSTPGDLKAVQ